MCCKRKKKSNCGYLFIFLKLFFVYKGHFSLSFQKNTLSCSICCYETCYRSRLDCERVCVFVSAVVLQLRTCKAKGKNVLNISVFVCSSCSLFFAITWFTLNSGIDGCNTGGYLHVFTVLVF